MQSDYDYDHIIVGGGPTGLALAQVLSISSRVLLIEKRDLLGGCHGVTRVHDGMMTEHGPRIYIDNFLMFTQLLNDMGVQFDDLFVKYNFSTITMMLEAVRVLSLREMAALGWSFMTLNDSYKETTLMEYLSSHDFSKASIDILDRIGRLTDGGSADTYTLFSFLQILNQNFLYGIYQPRVPNDVGLFRIWEDALLERGVVIMKNATIDRFIVGAGSENAASATVLGVAISDARSESKPIVCGCNNIILACPPQEVQRILDAHEEELGAAFGPDFDRFQEETQYLPYISVIFHWSAKLDVPKIWGYPRTAWGVGNIVLSDYMDFNDARSRTVISTVITMPDAPSDNVHLNVSANEISDKRAVMNEVFRQLQQVYPGLPEPDYQFLTQSAYDADQRRWVPFNHAFMTTTHGHVPNRSVLYENLYNCGVQNGNSSYSFTSMESSVANAIHLATELQPELKESGVAKVREAVTVRKSVAIVAAITLVAVIVLKQFRKSKQKQL